MIALDDPFPKSVLTDPNNEQVTMQLMQFVEERIQKRDLLWENIHQKQNNFRNILMELERENMSLKKDNASITECNNQLKNMIFTLESRIDKLQSQIDSLIYKLNNAHEAMRNMQQELRYRDKQLKQHATDKQKLIDRYNAIMQAETNRMIVELEAKLQQQREQLERCIKKKNDKLKLVKQILTIKLEDLPSDISTSASIVEDPVISMEGVTSSQKSMNAEELILTSKEKLSVMTPVNSDISSKENATKMNNIPIVNLRYQRSQNASKWINHYPVGIVPIGTILQPETALCKQTCVTKLTNPKTFATKSVKYCLYSQEQDTEGELETRLYKADVLPTCSGGAQVVFNDIECLKQISPTKTKRRDGQTSNQESSSART